jgi:DNA-binding SARP family transcriptional activator
MRETTSHLLPHAERLVQRVLGLEAPLVELWGWPGSGSSAVLQALLARPGATALALAELPAEGAARGALAAAADARWLVVAGDPGERLHEVATWLRPGQQLVFAGTRRRHVLPLPVALIPPQELLLTPPEVASLWHMVCGRQLGASASQALWRASDGWYRPLRMALEATGGVGLDAATTEQLLEIGQVRLFLRHEVLDTLPREEFERLLDAPRERPAAAAGETPVHRAGAGRDAGGPGVGAERGATAQAAWQVVEALGLWVEGGDHDRLPALLAASLARERRRRRLPVGAAVPGGAAEGGKSSAAAGGEATAMARAPSRPLYRVRLFGGPVILHQDEEGEREVSWTLRRSFHVLAFLASAPELQARREELEEAVWPTDGEQTIDRNFHPTLSHLRRALERRQPRASPPPLLFRGGIYRLNPEIDWDIDIQQFNRRIALGRELAGRGEERGAADAWQGAWKLYRGPFLHGHHQTWAVVRREAYQQLYVELLRQVGDLSVRLELGEAALDAYRAVLLEDPLQERTHLAVMRLYAGQGRRDLVRRQYERLCTLLLDELGVEPLPETVQEVHRLMS